MSQVQIALLMGTGAALLWHLSREWGGWRVKVGQAVAVGLSVASVVLLVLAHSGR